MGSKIVSIRCRRHKKRFNVEERWLNTCEWLCPQCYCKLSEQERRKYAPTGKDKPEVRPAEQGKPTVLPDKKERKNTVAQKKPLSFAERLAKLKPTTKNTPPKGRSQSVKMLCIYCGKEKEVRRDYFYTEHLFCPDCNWRLDDDEKRRFRKAAVTRFPDRYRNAENRYLKTVNEESRIESAKKERTSQNLIGDFVNRKCQSRFGTARYPNTTIVSTTYTPTPIDTKTKLSELMPRFKIHCQKCGEDVPCHGFWLDKSKVLCPQCASIMSEEEINSFNATHFPIKDGVAKNEQYEVRKRLDEMNVSLGDESDVVAFGGGCSEYFIRTANEQELLDAMERGKLSKVRYRMEMRRRVKPDYYADCHEDEERRFGQR